MPLILTLTNEKPAQHIHLSSGFLLNFLKFHCITSFPAPCANLSFDLPVHRSILLTETPASSHPYCFCSFVSSYHYNSISPFICQRNILNFQIVLGDSSLCKEGSQQTGRPHNIMAVLSFGMIPGSAPGTCAPAAKEAGHPPVLPCLAELSLRKGILSP